MVSNKLLAFANEFNRIARLGLFDPKFEFEDIESNLPLYSDEEIDAIPHQEGVSAYSDEELEDRLRALLNKKHHKEVEDEMDKAARRLDNLRKLAAFDPAVQELVSYINGMESAFLGARESTDDPLSRVILTGMWQDFLNFKHEKWKDSFLMLHQRGQEVA